MDEAVFKCKFSNGMFIWPILRYMISIDESIEKKQEQKKVNKRCLLISLIKGLFFLRFKRKKIIYITSTLFNVYNDDKKYYNILDDYYFKIFPSESVIYEYPADYNWRTPKVNKQTFTTFFYFELLANLLSRIFFKLKPFAISVESFHKSFPELEQHFLARYDMQISIYTKLLNLFFKYAKTKLLVINCGCYGMNNAVIINVAKKNGVKVAEIQHGIPNKVAYQENPHYCVGHLFKDYYPDYLFTFGEYWHSEITLPVECIPMGNPHLEYKSSNAFLDKKDSILIVSQPGETQKLLTLSVALRKLSSMIIIFRFHPMEQMTEEIYAILDKNSIEFSDSNTDLYNEFGRVKYICGVYSTCLYEAVAFNLKVFVLNTEKSRVFIDRGIGSFIEEANDIVNELDSPINSKLKENLWKSGFEQNYRNFVSKKMLIHGNC